jgi:geranylgeranyl pyrophosphate synthase
MDDDDTRRGQPSVHIKFSQGEAILAGDALLTEAFFLLAQTGLSRLALILAESAGSSGMVGGQAADIDLNTVKSGNDYGKSSERSSGKSSEKNSGKDIDYINNLKTAKLFEAAASMGAVIAGGSENDIEKAAVFGVNLGRAFQLRDDLLDDESEDIAQTRKKALGFVDRAKKTIMDINGSRNLVRIADYVINRNK